jgi:hypothetical protein
VKTYVMTTGTVFGLLALVHAWRAIQEGGGIGKDPWFLVITAAAAGLSVWAFTVLRRSSR